MSCALYVMKKKKRGLKDKGDAFKTLATWGGMTPVLTNYLLKREMTPLCFEASNVLVARSARAA